MDKPTSAADKPPVDILFDQDFIVLYQGLEPALCRAVVDRFDQDKGKQRGRIGGSAKDAFYEDDAKISWDLEILNEGPWRDIFQAIHPGIQACLAEYLSRSPILRSFNLQATGYKIQMYPRNEGRFRWHADSVGQGAGDRVVAMVLYLNDVAKGGETEFFHQGVKISPRAGHLVLFPAGWNYMHCGHVPESGDKYIISTFIRIKH
ncbi:MAG TPA: 2OG-Fe(II) oxygenase [Candidatus Aquabacterium excrementipullorum]|nr:2OG-Fe(II) oxygenase [Candidatus Aquabacterium excrementipullorum]